MGRGGIGAWLSLRLNYGQALARALRKVFPDHWTFLLGEVSLFALIYLLATGVFLGVYYQSGIDPVRYEGTLVAYHGALLPRAFAATLALSHDVPLGLLARRMHHFSAHVLLASTVLHAFRIYFAGAFRRPRELNWLVGLTLLFVAIFEGFTGYSLPYDQRGGTALRMAYTQALTLPWIGHLAAPLAFGPVFPSNLMMARIYLAHVYLLPFALLGLAALHVAIVILQSHTQRSTLRPASSFVVGSPIFPEQAARTAAVGLVTLALVALLAAFFPVDTLERDGPFSPAHQAGALEPDWFLFFSEGAYRLLPPIEWHLLGTTFTGPFMGGVLLLSIIFLGAAAYPFLDRAVYRWGQADAHEYDPPSLHPLRAAVGTGVISFLLLLSCGVVNGRIAGAGGDVYRVNRMLLALVIVGSVAATGIVFAILRRRRRDRPKP